jgi:hypothetical protein
MCRRTGKSFATDNCVQSADWRAFLNYNSHPHQGALRRISLFARLDEVNIATALTLLFSKERRA